MKINILYLCFLVWLILDFADARRRSRGNKNNQKGGKNKNAVNLDGPMELIMCGVRIIVTLYLGVIFQGKGDPEQKSQKDVMIRTGIVLGLIYFIINMVFTGVILWIKHFIVRTPIFEKDQIWGATYLNYITWFAGVGV